MNSGKRTWGLTLFTWWKVRILKCGFAIQGWKGSVKSRHFILALHDYMLEKVRNPNTVNAEHFLGSPLSTTSALDASSRSSASNSAEDLSVAISTDFSTFSRRRRDHDGWALAYISILRVQPLLEAFDDDATGWISVKEANQFTSSRPKDWSLSRWIAFWAAGWHSTIWAYQNKICGVLQAMLQTLTSVLHANRVIADGYLADSTFTKVDLLLRSVTPTNTYDLDLDQKMQPYVLEEEKRLEHNLQSVAWEIDDANTLSLITGPGRIERVRYLIGTRGTQITPCHTVHLPPFVSSSSASFAHYPSRMQGSSSRE